MRNRVWALSAAVFITAGPAAMAQSSPSAAQEGHKDLTVEMIKPTDSMIEMRAAVRELRKASVNLLNEKKPGPARQQAFHAAQDAISKVQAAMSKIMPDTTATIKQDAKSWPVIAGRFDRAAAALDAAVDNLSKEPAADQGGALQSAQAALNEVKSALHDLPDEKPPGAATQTK